MEQYRHALYRYSTGQGFSVNVDTPKITDDVSSYKMEPLHANLINPEFSVDLKREADRISMQVEAANQQLKVLGYDRDAGNRYKNLKSRLDVMQHLMTNYPIRYIKKKDLEKIFDLYRANSPEVNKYIHQVIEKNKGVAEVDAYIKTSEKLRKGYPVYDQFGKKLSANDISSFKKSVEKHSGLGNSESNSNKLIPLLLIAIIATIVIKSSTKQS